MRICSEQIMLEQEWEDDEGTLQGENIVIDCKLEDGHQDRGLAPLHQTVLENCGETFVVMWRKEAK